MLGEQVMLATFDMQCAWVCQGTVTAYFSAISHTHLELGFQDPLAGKIRLELVFERL